jgi:hypothetical protein
MRLSDHQLVAAAFDGALDQGEFDILQRRLAAEPELLAIYREHALLHHSLCEEFEGRQSIGDLVPPVARTPRWFMLLLVLMAVVALGLAAWKLTRPSVGDPATPKAGDAASAGGDGSLNRTPDEKKSLSPRNSEVHTLLEDRFDSGTMETGRRPRIGTSHWRLERGAPTISANHLEGTDFETFFWLPADGLSAARPILLVTVETVAGGSPLPFHSSAWAGFSLYQEGYEVCFFGDSFGPEETWSLDVKRSLVPLVPTRPITGPRTMTLRYDRRDGTVELHEGAQPGESPLVRSKLLPGLNLDQVRIGAGPGASLSVASLKVTATEDAR